jgi:predicted HTH transcriptional regulator
MAATKDAIRSKSESRAVDFKREFDPARPGDWCELVKDVVAIANSGGGSILVGVDDDGKCCGPAACAKLLHLDPAVITDKLAKYTGAQFDSFVINGATRRRGKIGVITIGCADPPMIFEKPGTYVVEDGKPQQKTAFGAGTLYVRHGAKSEPARYTDVVRLVERSVQRARKEWLSGVRKVSSAPRGSTISVLPPQVMTC